ncbi:hypothetical protein AB4Z39_25545 [Mycobacterium adipatum]|uniref:hypothetical protein n=1 Tax=Mycobacterium adipatum TaxID=1682113 RepID=UPI0034E0D8A2
MSGYDPHHLDDASLRCGSPKHPEHVARTCAQYEADTLGIKPAPWELNMEVLLRLGELFGNDYEKCEAFHAGSKAAADQTLRAFREAAAWHGYYSGTGQRWPGLAGYSDTVRRVLRQTKSDHRGVESEDLDFIDPQLPVSGACSAIRPVPFDEGDPDHLQGTVFGLVAGEPRSVYVLRAGYTPDRWLAELTPSRHRPCGWKSEDCLSYSAGEVTTFASGKFLIAVGTCQACFRRISGSYGVAR